MTVEAFDALGRRVWSGRLAPGAEAVEIDAAPWAAGAYVIRAASASATASATVVRR